MNGCMSDVLRSCFSYQVAVGSTTSEYSAVVHMRKSSVTSWTSLPSGASSRHLISSGLTSPISPRSFPCRPCFVPSMCRIMYSWLLPVDPSRFERQTNNAPGKFGGESGSAYEKSSYQEIGNAHVVTPV